MTFKFLLIPLSFSFMVSAMEEQEKAVKTIHDIGWYCAQLTKQTSEQPLFEGKGTLGHNSKVLPLNNRLDGHICQIVSDNANKLLQWQYRWQIQKFGTGNYQLYTVTGEKIPHGIELILHDLTAAFSFETIKNSYNRVIAMLQNGWNLANLEDNQDILHKKDPKGWNLFIRKKKLKQEDTLVRLLAYKFNLNNYLDSNAVSCYDTWVSEEGHFEGQDKLYLWVKKDKQAEFDRVFGFEYQ